MADNSQSEICPEHSSKARRVRTRLTPYRTFMVQRQTNQIKEYYGYEQFLQ